MSHQDRSYLKTQIETTESDIRGADSDTLKVLDDKIDLLPASTGAVTFNATALASVNAEVDTALNTIVPASPTAGSLNDALSKAAGGNTFNKTTDSLEAIADTMATAAATATATELAKVPKSDAAVTWNATALASVNAEVDTALNTIVPASPTAGSLNDALSKAAGFNTFNKATDSLEAIRDLADTLATPTNITAGTITTVTNLTNAPTAGDLTATMKTSVTTAVPTVVQIQSGLATPTNITAGTITTATNLTNAPTAGDLTATMKASVNAEVDTALNTAVPLTPTANSLNDILSKLDGANTFDNTTDSLEAIRDKIDTISGSRIVINGTCDAGMGASTTVIVSDDVTGYTDDYFNNSWWMRVVKNANLIGAAPTGEEREITDYVSATGTFTCTAFSANVEASDEIILIYKNVAGVKYQEYTAGSGNWTIPIGLDFCDVILVGAGGGGSGSAGPDGGCGGGGGETVIRKRYLLRGSTTIAYSVGAGGAGGASQNHGANGANTTFGTLTAYSGGGGDARGYTGTNKGYGGYFSKLHDGSTTQTGGASGIYWGEWVLGVLSKPDWGQDGKVRGGMDFIRVGGGGGGRSHATLLAFGGMGCEIGGTHTAGAAANSGGGGGSYGKGANGLTAGSTGNSAAANSGGGGSGGYGGATAAGGSGGSGYILITWR